MTGVRFLILSDLFSKQRLLVWGTINTSTRFILAISSSDFQHLTAGRAMEQGAAGKQNKIVVGRGNICLSHQGRSRAATPFIFSKRVLQTTWYSSELEVVSQMALLASYAPPGASSQWRGAELGPGPEPGSHPWPSLPHSLQTRILIHSLQGEKLLFNYGWS